MAYLFNLINAHVWPNVFTYRHRPESTSEDIKISLPYQKADSFLLFAIQLSLFGTQDLLIDIQGGLDGTDFFSILEKVIVPELDLPGTYYQIQNPILANPSQLQL